MADTPEVRTVSLLGSDYEELGEVAVRTLPPLAAIAISRGRFPKGYPYRDPNEDAVLAATDETSWLIAAFDGHNGFDAAQAAAAALADHTPTLLALAARDPAAAAGQALTHASDGARSALEALEDDRRWSRTALTVCVASGDRAAAATAGDAATVVLSGSKVRPLGEPSPFLGLDRDSDLPARPVTVSIHPGDLILCGTDGLFDFLGPGVLARLLHLLSDDPEQAVFDAVDAAFAGGAGDNVAVGALRRDVGT